MCADAGATSAPCEARAGCCKPLTKGCWMIFCWFCMMKARMLNDFKKISYDNYGEPVGTWHPQTSCRFGWVWLATNTKRAGILKKMRIFGKIGMGVHEYRATESAGTTHVCHLEYVDACENSGRVDVCQCGDTM